MTGLRTIWGVSLEKVEKDFGAGFKTHLIEQSEVFIRQQLLYIHGEQLHVTTEGQFLCDGIASELFKINIT
jgi:oxygen-independent coproporphyrinogen-3 oxidase